MREATLTITNKLGLHARAAAKVVSISARYEASILIGKHAPEVDAKSIMGLLTLGASKGTALKVRIEGPDEDAAMDELVSLFERKFDEDA